MYEKRQHTIIESVIMMVMEWHSESMKNICENDAFEIELPIVHKHTQTHTSECGNVLLESTSNLLSLAQKCIYQTNKTENHNNFKQIANKTLPIQRSERTKIEGAR